MIYLKCKNYFMNRKKIQLFIISHKKRSLLFSFITVAFIVVFASFTNIVRANFGSWGDTSLIHACISGRGIPIIVGSGDSCAAHETQSTWLKDVDAGNGLSITRASTGATISLANEVASLSSFQSFQVTPTDGQTTSSSSFANMTDGTQQIVLPHKSIVQVTAHANAFSSSTAYVAYIRVVYTTGGADTEIGKQGYTNATSDGQSISAGGVVTLNAGTYTIAMQDKSYLNPSGYSTFNQPSLSIIVIPTQ